MASDANGFFPPVGLVETPAVLRALVPAHRYLVELGGVARTIPNGGRSCPLCLCRTRRAAPRPRTTSPPSDALYRYQVRPASVDPASKDVAWYAEGLEAGFRAVRETGLLTANPILRVQAALEGNDGRAEPCTDEVWLYDYRTNIDHTLKKKPLRYDYLGNPDNLTEPDDIAQEIVQNLEAGLESFRSVLAELER